MILDDMRHGNYIVIRRKGGDGVIILVEGGGYYTIGNSNMGLCITINPSKNGFIFNSAKHLDVYNLTSADYNGLCTYMIDHLDDMYCVVDRYIYNGDTKARIIPNEYYN